MIVGACAGKFRIIHQGHVQYFVQAALRCDVVHIFFVSNDDVERYISEENTIVVISKIMDEIGKEYYIHQTDFKTGQEWDQYLIDTIGSDNFTIFNSKEDYENTLVKNDYLDCLTSKGVSATSIGKNIYKYENFNLIHPYYQEYLKKDIYIDAQNLCNSGDESLLDGVVESLRHTYGNSRFNFVKGKSPKDELQIYGVGLNQLGLYKYSIKMINKYFEIEG